MQITPTILNIPPYISTSWDQIAYIKAEKQTLIVTLKDGETISIPDLTKKQLQQIFDTHATYLENKNSITINNLSSMASMEHNPNDADLPDLPADILEKIVLMTKAIGGEEVTHIEPVEPNCNCTFCQIARALHNQSETDIEKINDEDLAFRDWQITQLDTKLYCVTSPLDANEQYKVFLGDPLGCTCGENHCEHIKAVLES